MLKAGDAAPDFDATDCQGRRVKLSLRSKRSAAQRVSNFWPALAAAGILIAVAVYIVHSRSGNQDVANNEKPGNPVVARVEERTSVFECG